MSNLDKMHILVIQPPVVRPSLPPWSLAQTLNCLKDTGLSPEPYDANLDFFLNHLLTSKQLNRLTDMINEKEKQGVFEKLNPDSAALLADLSGDPEKWAYKIDNVGGDLEVLKTEDFFRPERCLEALGNVHELLKLASLAYYPSQIKWSRFFNPRIENWSLAEAFIDDPETNPFLSLCRRGLASRLNNSKTRLLILCVSVSAQLLPALTMAHFSKKRHPELHVAVMGDHELPAGAEAYVDSLLSETVTEPLLNLVGRLSGDTLPADTAGPDFSGLPLKDYLSPALVLPLGVSKDLDSDNTQPKHICADLIEQQRVFNAKGFLSMDHRLRPTAVIKQFPETVEKEPPFCLCLSSHLNESAGREALHAARQAGVKIIRWSHPSGSLESLTQLLWDASRSGIWNHVAIAENQENKLERELVKFMAANPNIAHSWVFRRCSSRPFVDSYETLPEAAAYSQVAELSGRPIWHVLNDPVYMLLYLDRYGTKRLMRWRVRNKGSSLYGLGENIAYYFVKPQDLPPGYLEDICQMVEAGGSVDITLVRYNLERAFLIGYALEHGVIVGNSSLKRPRPEYVESVKKQSGLDLGNYLERGYTSVRPEYRGMGIGAKLLEGLTERVGDKKLFSIISSDNVAAQKMALRNRTRQVATFYSKKLGKEVGIWMPEWMIED